MDSSSLAANLCRTFCESITVRTVPTGFAISTRFRDSSGDRITFYARETSDGVILEDDGGYLATLIARDIPINEGVRASLLDGILAEGSAFWDRETLEIRTPAFIESELGSRTTSFLSSLIRVRDLELVSRDNVRSTFREDFIRETMGRIGELVSLDEIDPVVKDFSEFPADLVLRPLRNGGSVPAAVYLVSSNDKLNEALLAWQESAIQNRSDFRIIGVIEEPDMKVISRRKFQRAQNRRLPMPIFRGDEDSAINMIAKEMGVGPVHH